MTYSIIGRDPRTGHIGTAVASRFFAAGGVVPYTRGTCAIATQAFINPMYGIEGLPRLAAGESGAALLADFSARDRNARHRQVHVLDTRGRFAAVTGESCIGWAGHVIGSDCSVAGNMLAGPEVIGTVRDAFAANAAHGLPERLLAAMEAGERTGGDLRGRQSAALRVHRGEDYSWIDIRADDHPDPLAELRRLLAVAGERYLLFAEGFATRDNFGGPVDCADTDAAIAAAEARRAAAGIPSASRATPLPPARLPPGR
jgi:uncharacterized Ntn-hydrolase superfamily protein